MIKFQSTGDFGKTKLFLEKCKHLFNASMFDKYGQLGVEALRSATPVDTGKTASSWDYIIETKQGKITISWINTNINEGTPIAVIIQYGHGTGWGTYVKGTDYINPAMKPVFDKIAEDAWREVVSN